MSSKEFDMSKYFEALEEFKNKHKDKIIKAYGSIDRYNDFIERCKSKEAEIANMAENQYGSIEKYVEAMKKNYNSDAIAYAEQADEFRRACLGDKHPKLKELFRRLLSDLSKNPHSKEIQEIAEEITNTAKKDYEIFQTDMGDNYWYYTIQSFFSLSELITQIDDKYGAGSAEFIGEALKNYMGDNEPRLITLYNKLTADLSKDPHSKEAQEIIEEITKITIKNYESLKIDEGENNLRYTAELYLTNPVWINVTDNKYGIGASKFIGEALKFYIETDN